MASRLHPGLHPKPYPLVRRDGCALILTLAHPATPAAMGPRKKVALLSDMADELAFYNLLEDGHDAMQHLIIRVAHMTTLIQQPFTAMQHLIIRAGMLPNFAVQVL